MTYIKTTALMKLLTLKKRIKGIAGGTSAAKTISILQILIDKSQSDETPKVTSVVSESMPHLKRGAIRDFLNIMQEHGYFDDDNWNKTDFIYTFETGSKLEFFSADDSSKVRGPRRHRLFINEANKIPKDTFDQLEVRTSEEIWLDWNPVSEFWWYTDIRPNELMQTDFLTLTYKDNEGLPQSIIDSIEARRANKSWFRVYGQGLLGEAEGIIYSGWQVIDEVPHEAELKRYGLDFGYTNDPTALVAIYYYNGGFILDEILYQKGLLNKQIVDHLKLIPRALVIADSAEPKSIEEIKQNGVSILPALKGPGSVLKGIQYVQGLKISVTKRSLNILKEKDNFLWMIDKDGKVINEPSPIFNHSMDAISYGLNSLNTKNLERQVERRSFSKWQLG